MCSEVTGTCVFYSVIEQGDAQSKRQHNGAYREEPLGEDKLPSGFLFVPDPGMGM
jgi:hypothetical protein